MGNDKVTSIIRTLVPIWVGVFLTWLSKTLGVVIDEETVAQISLLVVGLIASIYYILARFAESKWPWVGWILGSTKTPSYKTEEDEDDD